MQTEFFGGQRGLWGVSHREMRGAHEPHDASIAFRPATRHGSPSTGMSAEKSGTEESLCCVAMPRQFVPSHAARP